MPEVALSQRDAQMLREYGRGADVVKVAALVGLGQEEAGRLLIHLCSLNRAKAREMARTGVRRVPDSQPEPELPPRRARRQVEPPAAPSPAALLAPLPTIAGPSAPDLPPATPAGPSPLDVIWEGGSAYCPIHDRVAPRADHPAYCPLERVRVLVVRDAPAAHPDTPETRSVDGTSSPVGSVR